MKHADYRSANAALSALLHFLDAIPYQICACESIAGNLLLRLRALLLVLLELNDDR